jgi:N-dimethylarginine dimethylaminohydrolase
MAVQELDQSFTEAREAPTMERTDRPRTPTELKRPAFLVNFPFSFSTEVANNIWMEELEGDEREPDLQQAMTQFLDLYRFLASEGLVYLLPTPTIEGLQDLVFTANLGIVLTHLDPAPVVISNFSSEPRRGESPIGEAFLESMGYPVRFSPHRFEGEADLKHLRDNVYVGGYGLRSEREAFEWMEREFDMKVIKVRETDPYLYHLDCSIFPLTPEDTMVCTEMFEPEELAELERHTNVIDVGVDECYSGICNSVRLSNSILNSSHIHQLRAGTEDYRYEVQKNRKLEDIAVDHAMEVAYFNLSEYMKGGALLSCMVMHLNRYSYAFRLV